MTASPIVQANIETVLRFFNGTHTGALDVIDDTVIDTIVTHGFPGGMNPSSRETYKQFFRDFASSFSDMRYALNSIVADERYVAVRFTIEVVHSGQFAGRPATGKPISFSGHVLYRMANTRIAETWLQVDELALLAQVGALATPQAA